MVRVIDRELLEVVLRERRGHPPLEERQLEYAGRLVRIRGVGFYHEEGQIYDLEGLPGFWDEECLAPDRPAASSDREESKE